VTRRELIALLGSTAAAWPLGARAQPPERMRRIGVVTNIAENDLEARARIAAFNDRLNQLGWIEDRNLQIETRLTLGDANLTRKYAAELVALSPMSFWLLAPRSRPHCSTQQPRSPSSSCWSRTRSGQVSSSACRALAETPRASRLPNLA
jgi:hypothetical protein